MRPILPGDTPGRPTRPILPGDTLDDRYELGELLGCGAFGKVYQARDAVSGRQVAVKVLLGSSSSGRTLRFVREGEAAARLDHPGIVRVHCAGQRDGIPFLVYELVEGARTLGEAWEHEAREGAALRQRVRCVRDAARAVGHAHRRGVVHRDLKPDNILVDGAGRVRVTDFGLALHADAERLTQTGALVGTAAYLAPEKVAGEAGRDDPAADVWSLGVVLYEALTNRLPFPGKTLAELAAQIVSGDPIPPRKHDPSLPRELERIALRSLSPDPARRYPDGEALAAALDGWLEGKPAARRGAWVAACLVSCALLGAGVAVASGGEAPHDSVPAVAASPSERAALSPGGVGLPPPQDLSQSIDAMAQEGLIDVLCQASFVDSTRACLLRPDAVGLYDLQARRLIGSWTEGLKGLAHLAVLPDGSGCLVGSSRDLWHVSWAHDSPRLLSRLNAGHFEAVAVAADGSGRWLLAVGTTADGVRVRALSRGWPLQQAETVFERQIGAGELGPRVGFDLSARLLWVQPQDSEALCVYDLESGTRTAPLLLGKVIGDVDWDPVGDGFALGLRNGALMLGTPRGLVALGDDALVAGPGITLAHTGSVRSVRFSPDGQRLYSLSHVGQRDEGGEIKAWGLGGDSPRVVAERALDRPASGLDLSPDGTYLLLSYGDAEFEVLRVEGLISR